MMNIFVSFFVMINKTKQNIKKFILSLIHIIIKLTYVKYIYIYTHTHTFILNTEINNIILIIVIEPE